MARQNDSTLDRKDPAATATTTAADPAPAAAHTTADDAVVTCETPAVAPEAAGENATAAEDVAAADGVASIDRAATDGGNVDPVFGAAALKDLVVYHGPDAELKWDTDLGPSVRMAAVGFLLLLFLMGVFAGIIWWLETTGAFAPAAT